MDPEKLQQAWQSQSCGTLEMNPDQLLKRVRLEQRIYWWIDVLGIALALAGGVFMWRSAFRDLQKNWPWLIVVASEVWIVGYVLFHRWRRPRKAATRLDESMLAHVDWSIQDIEHRRRVDASYWWWDFLPSALGCLIPPVLFLAMEDSGRPLLDAVMPWLGLEVIFVGIFIALYLGKKYGTRTGLEKERQELEALRVLRESLLHPEE